MKLIEENITQTLDEIYLIETLNLDKNNFRTRMWKCIYDKIAFTKWFK